MKTSDHCKRGVPKSQTSRKLKKIKWDYFQHYLETQGLLTIIISGLNPELFTTKRLILVDKQGLTGSKIEYKSISYKSISRFSVETAGRFDLDAELKIWISSEQTPSIKKQFNKSVNVYDVHNVLATHVLK